MLLGTRLKEKLPNLEMDKCRCVVQGMAGEPENIAGTVGDQEQCSAKHERAAISPVDTQNSTTVSYRWSQFSEGHPD